MGEEEEKEENEIPSEQETGRKSPFFNFADASLKRIDYVLLQIGMISTLLEMPNVLRQKKKIALIKTLLQYAYPLASDLFTNDFKKKILDLKIKKSSSIRSGNQRMSEIYDEGLDSDIDGYVIEICMNLQTKGYFMPSQREDDDDY